MIKQSARIQESLPGSSGTASTVSTAWSPGHLSVLPPSQLQAQTLYWHNPSRCWTSMKTPCIATAHGTVITYTATIIAEIFQHSQKEKGEKWATQSLWKFQNRTETANNRQTAASITNLIDFHEFGVGARPFYGHLDSVCRWRHGKPRESPKSVEPGSYRADGSTCLDLMRNDKKRKKSRSQCKGRANFASSLPVFTGGLGTRNGSGCTRHRAPLHHQPLRRNDRWGCQTPRVKAAKRRGPGEAHFAPVFSRKQSVPYHQVLLPTVPRLWTHSVQNARKLLALNRLRKDRLPRKSWSGSSISLKCFVCVTNRVPLYSNQDIMRKEKCPKVHTQVHTHSLPKASAHKAPLARGEN